MQNERKGVRTGRRVVCACSAQLRVPLVQRSFSINHFRKKSECQRDDTPRPTGKTPRPRATHGTWAHARRPAPKFIPFHERITISRLNGEFIKKTLYHIINMITIAKAHAAAEKRDPH